MSFYTFLKYGVVGPVAHLLCQFEVEGKHNLPKGGKYVIASNHLKWYDPLLLQVCLPVRIAYVAKSELFEYPVLGKMMVWAEQIPLVRADAGKRDVQAELRKQAAKRFERGQAVGIFPEGTRSKDGKLHSFMGGAVSIASASDRMVVPVGIAYSWSKAVLLVKIRVGRPIDTRGRRTRDVTYELQQRIADLSGQEFADESDPAFGSI